MAIKVLTEDEIKAIESQKGPSGLRRLLAEAHAEIARLGGELTTTKAEQLLRSGDYPLVKPEDLAGVEPDELAAKAQELQEAAEAAERAILERRFQAKGLEGTALQKAIDDVLGGGAPTPKPDDEGSFSAATIRGETPPKVDPSRLHGVAAIEAGLK